MSRVDASSSLKDRTSHVVKQQTGSANVRSGVVPRQDPVKAPSFSSSPTLQTRNVKRFNLSWEILKVHARVHPLETRITRTRRQGLVQREGESNEAWRDDVSAHQESADGSWPGTSTWGRRNMIERFHQASAQILSLEQDRSRYYQNDDAEE